MFNEYRVWSFHSSIYRRANTIIFVSGDKTGFHCSSNKSVSVFVLILPFLTTKPTDNKHNKCNNYSIVEYFYLQFACACLVFLLIQF